MRRPIIAALLFSASGQALAAAKPAKLARAHCEAALDNAVLFEDAPPVDERAIVVCEGWYEANASEAELTARACWAGAADRTGWYACRAPFAPEPSNEQPLQLEVERVDRDGQQGAGVLGALREGSELDGVFGEGEGQGNGAIGGLIGAKGTGFDARGLGSRGVGPGPAASSARDGSLGGDPVILGALDKSLIDDVIRSNLNQFRYCYQRELNDHPELSGKIVVKFVIAKDGSVASAAIKSSTMNDAEVEGCITGRFMRLQFPEPKGGGIVIVSYPFLFRPEP